MAWLIAILGLVVGILLSYYAYKREKTKAEKEVIKKLIIIIWSLVIILMCVPYILATINIVFA